MIERYALPELQAIFAEQRRLDLWLAIELLAAEGWHQAGRIPDADWQLIHDANLRVDPERVRQLERESQHDVLAFLASLTRQLGPEGRWLHFGLTSSDVLDTATAVQLRDATDALLHELDSLTAAVRGLALTHRATPMVGRTHGVHAEPTSFGFKAAGWYAELGRDRERLEHARRGVAVGKLSGAVGTHAQVSAEVEAFVCTALGLAPDPAASQVVSRDRHAELLGALAVLGGSLERIAIEVRHLQRTEVAEAFEPFGARQQGSSAMPHKRNPILAERVSGLVRLLRADALVGFENMALWHERDISHSSAERFVFERALSVAAYATRTLASVLAGLEVDTERMARNLELSGGAVYSEPLLLAMVERGADRDVAYRLLQQAAERARAEGSAFRGMVEGDSEIGAWLTPEDVAAAMDLERQLAGMATSYRQLGLDPEPA